MSDADLGPARSLLRRIFPALSSLLRHLDRRNGNDRPEATSEADASAGRATIRTGSVRDLAPTAQSNYTDRVSLFAPTAQSNYTDRVSLFAPTSIQIAAARRSLLAPTSIQIAPARQSNLAPPSVSAQAERRS